MEVAHRGRGCLGFLLGLEMGEKTKLIEEEGDERVIEQ